MVSHHCCTMMQESVKFSWMYLLPLCRRQLVTHPAQVVGWQPQCSTLRKRRITLPRITTLIYLDLVRSMHIRPQLVSILCILHSIFYLCLLVLSFVWTSAWAHVTSTVTRQCIRRHSTSPAMQNQCNIIHIETVFDRLVTCCVSL